MIDKTILQLIVAFDNIPYKGLFFWLSLLLSKDVDYDSFIKNSFADVLNTANETKEQLDLYKETEENLKHVRKQVLTNPSVRAQIEKIRDAIIDKVSHRMIMDKIKKDLESVETPVK